MDRRYTIPIALGGVVIAGSFFAEVDRDHIPEPGVYRPIPIVQIAISSNFGGTALAMQPIFLERLPDF